VNIDGKAWRTIWLEEGGRSIGVIDQTQLPHRFTTRSIATLDQVA
jgi:methylthioribose-1-phosphate isomerase